MNKECNVDQHVWGTDGAHSNEYCKVCFANKPIESWRLLEFKARLEDTMRYLDSRQPTAENRPNEIALDCIARTILLEIANNRIEKLWEKLKS